MLVRDVMRTELTLFTPETTFKDAIRTFIEKDMESTAIVADLTSRKLVGVVSLADLITKMVPDYLEADPTAATFEAEEFFKKCVLAMANVPVADCMTTAIHSVHDNHTLIEVATLIAKYGVRSVPVVEEGSQKIVGYISRRDVKRAMHAALQ